MQIVDIEQIRQHPINSAIYGDMADDDLINSIEKVGILNPLLITKTGIIISGHRRFNACQALRIYNIPVIYSDLTDENDIVEALIISNSQREKTNEQKAREYSKLKEIEEVRAKERMEAGNNQYSPVENLPQGITGKSRDVAASKIGMSGKTAESAAKVVKTIDTLIELGEDDTAQDLKDTLNKSVSGALKKAHVSNNSGENEWYTPEKYIESARYVMRDINLDPASCELANETVGADKFYNKEDNGLNQEWFGNIWLNPPYSQPLMSQFANAVAEKYDKYEQAIILVNNATETVWFRTIAEVCSAICFVSGRVKFLDKHGNPGAPLQGQCIFYVGNDNVQKFHDEFKKYGLIFVEGDY